MRGVLRSWALLCVFGAGCGQGTGDAPPEVTGACLPLDFHEGDGVLPEPSSLGTPRFYTASAGSTRPDCQLTYDLLLRTEAELDELDVRLELDCGLWKMGADENALDLIPTDDGWVARATVRADACLTEEARASANGFDLPFHPAKWALWVELGKAAPAATITHRILAVDFDTWDDGTIDLHPSLAFDVPEPGQAAENPVELRLTARDVARVRFFDHSTGGWLGAPIDVADSQVETTWEFEEMGTRLVTAFGYDASGRIVTTAVQQFAPVQTVRMNQTYYYVAYEDLHPGDPEVPWLAPDCVPYDDLGHPDETRAVSSSFYQVACREGTARLSDGRVFNVVPCGCPDLPDRCGSNPTKYCWEEVSTTFPWGKGSRNNALEPLRSAAVNGQDMKFGQVVHVEMFDGRAVPAKDGVPATTHDGCFRADDVGSAIDPRDIDLFTGPESMYTALRTITSSAALVVIGDPRCDAIRRTWP